MRLKGGGVTKFLGSFIYSFFKLFSIFFKSSFLFKKVCHDSTISIFDSTQQQLLITQKTPFLPFTSIKWINESEILTAVCFLIKIL